MAAAEGTYLPRLVDGALQETFSAFPAVLVVGPRACGKTTSSRRLVTQIDRLDDPGTAGAYRMDPDAALRRADRPLLLDEFQLVPELQPALKRAVDADPRPGQFLLTGSARAQLDGDFWAATGRIVHLRMQGLVEREVSGSVTEAGFVRRLARSGLGDLRVPSTAPDIDGYVDLALRSGFPFPALRLARATDRRRWLASYLENVTTRDAALAGEARNPVKLRDYLRVVALSTAGQPSRSTLYRAAGINQRTASAYDDLLANLFVTDPVPAWPVTGNRLKALTRATKIYLADPGLAAVAAGITREDLLDDTELLGRFFDTFAAAQLRADVAGMDPEPRRYHLREQNGRSEVDLVLDMGRRRVVGIELKAGRAVDRRDARHLETLRDDLGADFLAGAVLYSGRHLVELGDRIFAVPLCSVWS